MCLKTFCGYFSLYIGCIFIGVTGVIMAVMVFSVGLFELISNNEHMFLKVGVMLFALIHGLGRIFLLFGTMWDMCWAIILAFFIGIVSFILMVAVVVIFCLAIPSPIYYLLACLLIMVEVYYLWLIISTWWCCRSCTQDC